MNVDDTIKIIENAVPEETKYQEWQPIKDSMKLDDPPPFPLEAMPEILRNMAEGISLSRKVPVAMSATAVLAAVGMAIGRNVYFQRKRGFEGRANLYALVFAARGERKSVTFRPALYPFYKWMKDKEPAYRQRIKEYRRNAALMENLETALSKPGLKENRRKEYEDELAMLEHEIGEVPRNPWFLADDVTPEALFKLMQETDGTAGIFNDDARLVIKMLLGSVYSNSGEGREDFLLRPFDGEQPLIRRRVGTGNDYIERPCIGMLLMLQTDFLKKIGSALAFFESGLASRCIFCYPESWVGKRDENGNLLRADDDYEIPWEVEKSYQDLISDLLERAYNSNAEYYYPLSMGALDEWRKFYHEIEAESGPEGKYEKMQDFAIRYPTLVLRLALQLAVIENHKNITREDMLNGIKLMHYFMASAQRCHDAMNQISIPDNARRILNFWQKDFCPNKPCSIRDITRGLRMLKGEVEEALKLLIERNYCRYRSPDPAPQNKCGRTPSPRLEINPQFFE